MARFYSNTSGTVSLTSGQFNDAGTLTLPPGTWDLQGNILFTPAASTVVTRLISGIGTATGNVSTGVSVPENGSDNAFPTGSVPTSIITRATPTWRVTITVSTTYYLKPFASFSVSTCTALGFLRATQII